MRYFIAFAGLLVLFPPSARAGHIFGALRDGGRPAGGADIAVTCGGTYRAQTDKEGAYRLFVRETARCTFQVNYRGQSSRTEIFSYNEPTRYDFDLVWEKGRLTLRRR